MGLIGLQVPPADPQAAVQLCDAEPGRPKLPVEAFGGSPSGVGSDTSARKRTRSFGWAQDVEEKPSEGRSGGMRLPTLLGTPTPRRANAEKPDFGMPSASPRPAEAEKPATVAAVVPMVPGGASATAL